MTGVRAEDKPGQNHTDTSTESRAWEATEPHASPPLFQETFPTWQDLHFEPETLAVQLHGGAQPFQKALLAPCKVG